MRTRNFGPPIVDHIAHYLGQIVYLALEAVDALRGRSIGRRATKLARRASHRYWRARALRRNGRKEEALSEARVGYGILRGGEDRLATLAESILILRLLDGLATEMGKPEAAQSELSDALEYLNGVGKDAVRKVPELEYWRKWLGQRVLATSSGR